MADLTGVLNGPWQHHKIILSPEAQLIDSIEKAGLEAPESVELDGRIHRFGRKKTSWYVAYGDGIPAGRFGDWKLGVDHIFRAEIDRDLTIAENMAVTRRMAEAKAARDAEIEKRHEVTSNTVQTIWDQAGLASSEHEYIARKGIQPHGARITGDGRLMVPIYDGDELASIQYIDRNGDKRYHTGGKTGGCYWSIGEVTATVYVAEGFATAATIHELTGCQTYIAFSASNIPATVSAIKGRPTIVVVADNDQSGVGKSYADQASAKYGCRVVMPPMPGMDANDYHQAGHDLLELLEPPKSDWLVPASEYAAQPAPISWLIKGWVQDNALVMVHGPSGGGKTFVVLDWCLSIAAKKDDWLDNRIHGGSVVYLAGEGHHGLRSRIAAWGQRHDTVPDEFYISRSGCDLNTPEGFAKVAQSVDLLSHSPKLIVVDTLHRFLLGDENSAQDAKTMLDACNELMARYECSVILVHHTGVNEEAQHRARGSSAWRGALDIEVSVVPAKGDKPIEIVQRKSKDAEMAEPVYVRLEKQEIDGWIDEDGDPVSSAVLIKADAPEKDDGKLRSAKKLFENMWHESGRDLFCDAPYVSNSFAKEAFVRMNHSNATATKYATGGDRGPLAKLREAGLLRKDSSGWVAEDAAWILSLKN
jgi:phage/plasmid primase-like uncharacterized protein